jgi:hypothetical protein
MWLLLALVGVGAGAVYAWQSRPKLPEGFISVKLAASPQMFGNVSIDRAVLVPRAIVDSGDAVGRSWSAVMTGTQVVAEVWDYSQAAGIPFVSCNYLGTEIEAETSGPQGIPSQVKQWLSKPAAPTITVGLGATPIDTRVVKLYSAFQKSGDDFHQHFGAPGSAPVYAVHGADHGLTVFPPALYRPKELRAWSRHFDIWLYGGPVGHRAVIRHAVDQPGPTSPGAQQFWKSPIAPPAEQNYPHMVRHLGGVISSDPLRKFGVPSTDHLFANYVQLCMALSGWGLLPSPTGQFAVPPVKLATESRGMFSAFTAGIKQAVFQNGDLAVAMALGNPKMFGAIAAVKTLETFQKMSQGARAGDGKVPWHPSWAPVLVDRSLIGIKAEDYSQENAANGLNTRHRYHTFGDSRQHVEGSLKG